MENNQIFLGHLLQLELCEEGSSLRTIKRHQVVRLLSLLFFSGVFLIIMQLCMQVVIEEELDHDGGYVLLPDDGSIFISTRTPISVRLWWWSHPGHSDYDEIQDIVTMTAEKTGHSTESELPQRLRPVWHELRAILNESDRTYAELAVNGWPFRCFYGGAAITESGSNIATQYSIILEEQPWTTPLRDGWLFVYGVIWLGLLANYAITVVVLWLVVGTTKLGWRITIGSIRQRRGRCRECGYDLRGQSKFSGCPECGWNRAENEGKVAEVADVDNSE